MYRHTTDEVVMIRPVGFYFNAATAVNNAYQQDDGQAAEKIQEKAIKEFDNLVAMLEEKGIKVNVLTDTPEPSTPDSIFPNNWFSTHEGGQLVIYPMFAENRQQEIAKFYDEVKEIALKKQASEKTFAIYDYRENRFRNQILEGTGSMVIDRTNRVAYCTLSPRADEELLMRFCRDTGHEAVIFRAYQDGVPIYHTNVLMGIGPKNAIICLDSIEESSRERVREALVKGGKNIIDISLEQVKLFLGNTLELQGKNGNVIAMSKTAYDSLTSEQKATIEEDSEILAADISTIEFYGGGSVRCMIAEIF